jgi:hypothetical protein
LERLADAAHPAVTLTGTRTSLRGTEASPVAPISRG